MTFIRRSSTAGVPVYQVDFCAAAAGKKIAVTKRRIRWRFGFANTEALSDGAAGVDCRGQEHEVVIVWSVTSGKRQILVDGRELHSSLAPGGKVQGKFEYGFNFLGQHVVQLVAHAGPPISNGVNGAPQRQFDLILDGLSFFDFPKIFQLGAHVSTAGPMPTNSSGVALVSPSNSVTSNQSNQSNYSTYSNYSMESFSSQQSYARQVSDQSGEYFEKSPEFAQVPDRSAEHYYGKDVVHSVPPACITPTGSDQAAAQEMVPPADLLDMSSPVVQENYNAQPNCAPTPPVAPPQSYAQPIIQDPVTQAPPRAVLANVQQPNIPPTQSAPAAYHHPSQGMNDMAQSYPQQLTTLQGTFVTYNKDPVQQPEQPMGQYQFQQVSHDIMTKYEDPAPKQIRCEGSEAEVTETAIVPHEEDNLTVESNSKPLLESERNTEQGDLDEISKAMKDLVNVNDISAPPDKEVEMKLSILPKRSDQQEQDVAVVRGKNGKVVRSKGIEPPASNWNGPQPSLSEMKANHIKKPRSPSRDVMTARTQTPTTQTGVFHSSAVQPGALVVYGVPMDGGGPPPLNAAGSGFGVVHHQHQHEQAQQPYSYGQPLQQVPYQYPVHS